jgi:hypothetical protein
MSISSTSSSNVVPSRSAAAANGYRLTTTSSKGAIPAEERLAMLAPPAVREDAGMDRRVERLHAAVEDLGEAGDGAHVRDRQAGIAQRPRRAAGRDQLEAACDEAAPELREAGLVAAERSARRGTGSARSAPASRSVTRARPRDGTAGTAGRPPAAAAGARRR